jgi:hypothetical protein
MTIRVRLAHQAVYIDLFQTDEGRIVAIPTGLQPSPFDARPKQKKLQPLSDEEIEAFENNVFALEKKLTAIVTELKSLSE